MPDGEAQPDAPGIIQALDTSERGHRAYRTFRIEMDDGCMIDCPLIPSQLTSVEWLQQEVGASAEYANLMRRMMEEAFLDSFLAMD